MPKRLNISVAASDLRFPSSFTAYVQFITELGKEEGDSFSKIYLLFPRKPYPQAALKSNIRLRQLLLECNRLNLNEAVYPVLEILHSYAYEDGVVAAILYFFGLRPTYGQSSLWLATMPILFPERAKHLSICVKSCGLNFSLPGAMLAEQQCLLGRGVGTIDVNALASERTDVDFIERSVIRVDQAELAATVREILNEELMGRDIVFDDLDSFWSRRWAWCVNGSHNTVVDAEVGVDMRTLVPEASTLHRRMFAEAVVDEPISNWSGIVHVSPSPKLEHGKTRLILACDSLSYFAFEHLLGPVSAAWLQRRILMDPGKFGQLGLAEKVNNIRSRGGVAVMLDYDDFNSQHSNESMATVIRETGLYTGYPKELLDKLCNSFDNTYIGRTSSPESRVKGTLMSGHRGTSFLNSILNAAYVRLAVGRHLYGSIQSIHVGDDIFINATSFDDAQVILANCKTMGCRMNTLKQSVGQHGAEFLRMCITSKASYGYLARSISSTVSGNWTNLARLSKTEFITSIMGAVHTLENRSGIRGVYPSLLSGIVSRYTGCKLKYIKDLLNGAASLDNTPCFGKFGTIRRYTLLDMEKILAMRAAVDYVDIPEDIIRLSGKKRDEMLTEFFAAQPLPKTSGAGAKQRATLFRDQVSRNWPSYSTGSYLRDAAAPIEIRALEYARVNIRSYMLASSYSKTIAGMVQDDAPEHIKVARRKDIHVRGSVTAEELVHVGKVKGLLEPFPLIQLIKQCLSREQLMSLGRSVSGGRAPVKCYRDLFYERDTPCNIIGVASYSDAGWLSGRSECTTIYFNYPCYF